MKKVIIIVLLDLVITLVPCLAGPAVLVLDEIDIPYFGKALEGFESACSFDMERFDISKSSVAHMVRHIREKRPRLIYLRGVQSLKKVRELSDIPVVYSLALHPGEVVGDRPNFTGVGLRIPDGIKFDILRKAMPGAERVGMIYSGGMQMEAIRLAAGKFGFRMIARKLYDLENFPDVLGGLIEKIDVFMMAPNLDVYRKRTVDCLFEFSREHMIPVVTYNERFLEMGALLSIHPGPRAMGAQAGDMANRILGGLDVSGTPFEPPRDVFIKINPRTVVRLGLEISKEMVEIEEKGYKERINVETGRIVK